MDFVVSITFRDKLHWARLVDFVVSITFRDTSRIKKTVVAGLNSFLMVVCVPATFIVRCMSCVFFC